MTLKNLTPITILKIKTLTLKNLKIQIKITNQNTPYTIKPLTKKTNFTKKKINNLQITKITLLKNNNSQQNHTNQNNFISINK